MLMFNPWYYSCAMLRASNEIWARNFRAMQVFFDAGVQQNLAMAGFSNPIAAANICAPGKVATISGAAKKRATRKPSPPPMPDSNVGLDDADMPV